ncbi:hypothetical protein ACOSP7_009766 [Xanthoceras sorbifolium]
MIGDISLKKRCAKKEFIEVYLIGLMAITASGPCGNVSITNCLQEEAFTDKIANLQPEKRDSMVAAYGHESHPVTKATKSKTATMFAMLCQRLAINSSFEEDDTSNEERQLETCRSSLCFKTSTA